ncbi:MAG: hypothetical protein HKN76_07870 [Saprospiraceae bacterium]|nr:hypothetical protein [Saprospiraceae bacterium]
MLNFKTTDRKDWVSHGFWLCAFLCFGLSISYSVNIPFLDDYGLVLDFLSTFTSAHSPLEKLQILGTPVNNHLIVTYYLLILMDYEIFGEIDFQHLIFAINLCYLAILYVIYRIFISTGIRPYYFIPVILLFSIPVYNLINWSSSGMHVLPVLFALLTILAFVRESKYPFTEACIYATLAALSSGGGMLAFICAVPFLLQRKNTKEWTIWILIFSSLLFIYVHNFGSMGHTFAAKEMITYVINLLVFFGTIFKPFYGDHHLWGIIFGFLILGGICWTFLFRWKFLKENPILLAGLALALALALLTTITRSQLGLGVTTAYRYRLYHMLPLIFLYLFLLKSRSRMDNRFYLILVSISVILYGFRMEDAWSVLQRQGHQLQMGMEVYRLTGSPDQLSYRSTLKAKEILTEASNKGHYHIPSGHKFDPLVYPGHGVHLQSMHYHLNQFKNESTFVVASGWAYPSFASSVNIDILFWVESKGQKLYFRTAPFLSNRVLMAKSDLSFLIILDKSRIPVDWAEVNFGLALIDPIRGITSETSIVLLN